MPITTTPSGGPQGEFSTYTPIAVYTVSGTTTNSMSFTNVPSTYTDLVLVVNSRLITNPAILLGQFNGDTGSNYSTVAIGGDGTNVISNYSANATSFYFSSYAHQNSGWSTYVFNIMNYSSPSTYKTVLKKGANASYGVDMAVNLWRSYAPINRVDVYLDRAEYWTAGSTITLYGVKAAATAPKAVGGDAVYTDNTYWYHVFKTAGVFDVKQTLTADFLVVGGGGGGGYAYLGGGGAGGYRTSVGTSGRGAAAESQFSLTAKQYSVLVGAGGTPNIKGNDSTFHTVTSLAGGAGGTKNGGSGAGGGASTINPAAGTGTTAQGYDGGDGNASNNATAGGGGAAGNGTAASGFTGGNGGAGINSSISGFSTGYAGGGGGGSGGNGGTPGTASHGGGAGGRDSFNSSAITATSGTANTGGGGGSSYTGVGSNGGSGVVIVRYAV